MCRHRQWWKKRMLSLVIPKVETCHQTLRQGMLLSLKVLPDLQESQNCRRECFCNSMCTRCLGYLKRKQITKMQGRHSEMMSGWVLKVEIWMGLVSKGGNSGRKLKVKRVTRLASYRNWCLNTISGCLLRACINRMSRPIKI